MTRQEMERIWEDHVRYEFVELDVDGTMSTMVADPSVSNVPVGTGGRGWEEVRTFYRDSFIGSWPDDLEMTTVSRTFGDDRMVEEVHLRFTHSKRMNWLLPGVLPTNRVVDIDFVVVGEFRDGKLACERIYWDQATVLRQVGLLHDSGTETRVDDGRGQRQSSAA
jgi:carboxymethylenebutenolidase